MNAGDVAVEEGELERAMREYGAAAELLPDSVEVQYWAAVTLATTGSVEASLPRFRKVFAIDPAWIELTRRLTKPGVIPDDDAGRALIERIVSAAAE
jgi:tetratricopeptide (TPR) repeat protein